MGCFFADAAGDFAPEIPNHFRGLFARDGERACKDPSGIGKSVVGLLGDFIGLAKIQAGNAEGPDKQKVVRIFKPLEDGCGHDFPDRMNREEVFHGGGSKGVECVEALCEVAGGGDSHMRNA